MIQEMGVAAFLAVTQDLGIDILLPNYEEGSTLTGLDEPESIAARLTEIYPGRPRDAEARRRRGVPAPRRPDGAIPPATNNLVDATGAGDSFAGAFLAHYLRSGDALAAATLATDVSAWVIEHLGARPAPDARLRQVIGR